MFNKSKLPDPLDFYSRETETPLRTYGDSAWGRCHFHEDHSPSCSYNLLTGRYYCVACTASGDMINFVMERYSLDFIRAIKYLGAYDETSHSSTTTSINVTPIKKLPKKPKTPNQFNIVQLREVWSMRNPVGELAKQYFISRGLASILNDLPSNTHYIPSLSYFRKDKNSKTKLVGDYPCLLFSVHDSNGKIVTMHRLYLNKDGAKFDLVDPENPTQQLVAKKLMGAATPGSWIGGAIRLYPCNDELAIAEGPETALAVRAATGFPVWSTITAGNMEHVIIPDLVKKVFIFADKDRGFTGERVAKKLAGRLLKEGREVRLLVPPGPIPQGQKSLDWLDVLVADQRVEVA